MKTTIEELEAHDMPDVGFHALRRKMADWPLLESAQCQRVLTELVEPNLRDQREWLKTLGQIKATLEAEAKWYTTPRRRLSPFEQERKRECATSLRQLHDGLFHDGLQEGIAPQHAVMLAPVLKRKGEADTVELIAKLEHDAAYLRAYVARWPTPDTKRKFKYAAFYLADGQYLPVKAERYYEDGTIIEPGDIREMTETQSRGEAHAWIPVDLPEVLRDYPRALHRVRGEGKYYEVLK